MDDQVGLARVIGFGIAGYPVYLARTLIQLGYEPQGPNQHGKLPNLFSYLSIIKDRRGYLSLYTGLRFYLPEVILKNVSYDVMASMTNHKRETEDSDVSEIIAVCLRQSLLKIHSTVLTYPLVTLGVGYISTTFFGSEDTIEFTVEGLYRGLIPKLITEVVMVWVTIISRCITASFVKDKIAQAIITRVPLFIAGGLLYPLNVVTTVMADNGRSRFNPKFDNWRDCYRFLSNANQLKRGASFFQRRYYPLTATPSFAKLDRIMPAIE